MHQLGLIAVVVEASLFKKIIRLSLLICLLFLGTIGAAYAAPSLLLDKRVSNTSPNPGETFRYTIRYRCASLTEHCTGAQIVDALPSDLNIQSYSPASGNIASATDDGNNTITWAFTDPLPAGSTGALNINANFLGCGTTQPSPVTNSATFSASNASSISASAPTVTMNGALSACPVPVPPSSDFFKQAFDNIVPTNGSSFYRIYPDTTATTDYVVVDQIPQGMIVNGIDTYRPDGSTNLGYEFQCNGGSTWHSYTSISALDKPDEITPFPGCEAVLEPASLTGSGREFTYFNITAIRYTVPAGSTERFLYWYTLAEENPFSTADLSSWVPAPVGSQLQNCAVRTNTDTTTETACVELDVVTPRVIPELEKIILGSPTLVFNPASELRHHRPSTGEDLSTTPQQTQGKSDMIYAVTFKPHRLSSSDWDDPVIVDLLPPELTFDPSKNWWRIVFDYIEDDFYAPTDQTQNNPACYAPQFTAIEDYQSTGRTALVWDFTGCKMRDHFYDAPDNAIIFSTTIKPGTVAGTIIDNTPFAVMPLSIAPPHDPSLGLHRSTCQSYFGYDYWPNAYDIYDFDQDGDTTELLCRNNQLTRTSVGEVGRVEYTVPVIAEMNSSKYVQGKLDSMFDRFPTFGDTDQTGEGTYEMFIENGGNVNVTQFDVVDFLPFVGDTGVLSANGARESNWEMQLANAISVERYNSTTGAYDPVPNSDLLDSEVKYSTSNNPCRFNGVEAFDNLSITGDNPAACTALSSSAAAGAKSFGFRFTPSTAFSPGEKLKITVNVAISGTPPANSGDIAWNSFGYSGIYQDGGDQPLINSEPIKVGLRMIDTANRAALGDVVWFDSNHDGIQDASESGIENVTVNLYASDGTTLLDVARTDSSGFYRFDNLDPSTQYVIKLDNASDYTTGSLAGLTLTLQNQGVDSTDNDAALNGDNYPEISVTTNAADGNPTTGAAASFTDTYDFGFWLPAALGNYVWYDTDGFGDQSVDEKPVENMSVKLYDTADNLIATVATDASGYYLFDPLPAGNYYLVFDKSSITGIDPVSNAAVNEADWEFTSLNATGVSSNDSDANGSGRTINIVLEAGERDMTWDAGIKPYTPPVDPVSVGNYVWEDSNNNGIQDSGELGIENVRVDLIENGFPTKTTYTDSSGLYQFDDIERNTSIQIRFTPPAGSALTQLDQGSDDTLDSDADPVTGDTIQFVLNPTVATTGSDTLDPTWDAGVVNTTLSLGNQVWKDSNKDGLYSVGEPVLAGLTVNLLGTATATTTTDSNGRYLFTGLSAGNYQVEVQIPAGLSVTATTANTANPDSGTDSDNNGVDTTTNAGFARSNMISLELGGGDLNEPDHGVTIGGVADSTLDRNADYTLDFGFIEGTLPCSITATAIVNTCTNVGSDADSSNDTYTISLNVTGENASSTYNYSSAPAGVNEAGIAYTASPYTTPAIIIESTTSPLTLTVIDAVDVNCSTTITPDIVEPATCSSAAPQTDLEIIKTVNQASASSGDTLIYTLTVNNNSSIDATGVVVSDPLPTGVTYVSDDGGATTSESAGTVTWNMGNLAASASAILNITVTVD